VINLADTHSSVKITILRCFKPEEVFKNPPVKSKYSLSCEVFKDGQEFIIPKDKYPKMPEGFSDAWAYNPCR
jgi:hypothetical protein